MDKFLLYKYDDKGKFIGEMEAPLSKKYQKMLQDVSDGKGSLDASVRKFDTNIPNTTTISPPQSAPQGQVWIYNPVNNGWLLTESHIGEIGWVNHEPFVIKEHGPYPEGWKTEAPQVREEIVYPDKYDVVIDGEKVRISVAELMSGLMVLMINSEQPIILGGKTLYKPAILDVALQLRDGKTARDIYYYE